MHGRYHARLAGALLLAAIVQSTSPPADAGPLGRETCYNFTGTVAQVCLLGVGTASDCATQLQDSNGIHLLDTDPADQCAGDERTLEVDPPPKYPIYLPEGIVGEGTVFPATNTDGGPSPCTWTPDNPHYSDKSGGVIAKSRWTCDPDVSFTYYYLTLFNCNTSSPSGREADWVSSGQCYVVSKPSTGTIQDPGDGIKWPSGKRIRYVPKKGDPPGRTNGWYIQCVQWYYGVGNQEYRGGQVVSQPVHITVFPA